MRDLCAGQEEPADGAMENPAGTEAPATQGERAEQRGPAAAGDPVGPLKPSVLGKRHHSLYEGLNGCDVGAFRKVRKRDPRLIAFEKCDRKMHAMTSTLKLAGGGAALPCRGARGSLGTACHCALPTAVFI